MPTAAFSLLPAFECGSETILAERTGRKPGNAEPPIIDTTWLLSILSAC